MIVLDTNICSALMSLHVAAEAHLALRRPREVILTAPVAAEILYSLERLSAGSRRRRNLESEYQRLRSTLAWADWTEAAATVFAREKARLAAAGAIVEDMDIAIAASAISLGAGLATRNVRHMTRFEELVVEDWSSSLPAP